VTPKKVAADAIEQTLYHIAVADKRGLLHKLLRDNEAMRRVIVFTRTKHGANKVQDQLEKAGFTAEAIHGNKSQNARQRALEAFRSGDVRVLVATDIAARGIDIDGISHVVNFDLPHEPESYVHRIGRTARAGSAGIAIAFCAPEERTQLKAIEKLIRQPLTVIGTPQIEAMPVQENHAPRHNPRGNHRPHGHKKPGHKQNNGHNAHKPQGEKREGQAANTSNDNNNNRPRRRRKFRGNRNGGQQRAA
jgi:ATP-dependent RNA helicase RhlE